MQPGRYLFLFLFFTVQLIAAGGQPSVVDSLKNRIEAVSTPKEKISAILDLCEQNLNADAILPYVVMAETLAAGTADKSAIDKAAYCRAGYYARKNITDSALSIVESLLTHNKADKNQQPFYLKLLFLKAKILDRSNQYTKALTQLIEVIETAEILKDTLIQIQAKTGIGWVQMEMEQYKEALQWLYKAMHTSTNKKFYKNYGALYSNIATSYNALGSGDSAQHYIGIAIKNARESDNLPFLATALSMQAKILIDSKQSHLAEAPLNEVLEIRKKLDDPFYIVYDMSNLASYYASINQPQKGIELCKEGIALAKQRGMPSQLMMIYRALAENYKAAGNADAYGQTLENIIVLKDSFNRINSSKLLAEMQAGNAAQKKEKTIMEQKLNLTKKNYWLYGSALFGLMAAIVTWVGFKNYRRRQKLKMAMALEEEKRISAQAVIKAEEQERKRIAADLHDNLGAYAASIASNLDHIKSSQTNTISETALQELRNNSQSIVSQLSDTIWAMKKDALSLTAISDRIKVFIQRLRPSYPAIHLDVEEKIENDQLLAPSQAFHLFKIIQEAIINALKHSGGKNISVIIETRQEQWKVSIRDDGKGMIAGTGNGIMGNGLTNMKNRAKEGAWDIMWEPNENTGTSVMISSTTN